ncbi:prolyl oligopeptidase family serine peptidase [Maribacter confluentis]|uniref:Prolyl oligopeptidase family serine peptidase n=1 Tax=Maribacter confluentis TaxID=1656093 RepID=A0ABT8RS42_9FLAO|nr:prolyl oligopeptidase family serine peptidase [Maribacter confluentis]MDO1513327.1 prolyl oligopeptidase family serine peptidase [Maribacter confluentis]
MNFKSFLLVVCFTTLGFSQQKEITLWPDGVPGSIQSDTYEESATYDELEVVRGVSKVSQPTLTPFLADASIANGSAVIICPGGGYTHLAINKEGYKVAKWLNTLGISAFVLKYRMPTDETMTDKTVGPLQDAQEAMRMVRKNAKRYNIDASKIGILGFSAGGHLASTLSTHFNDKVYEHDASISARPDFSVLVYPVISMKEGVTHEGSKRSLLGNNPSEELLKKYSNALQVTSNTPPTFLVHASDDTAVPVENSLEYYDSLKKHKVSAELHMYENGGHGFGLGVSGTNANWPNDLKQWFLAHDLVKKDEVYIFSYFVGNGEDGLHFAYSEDGYSWESLRNGASYLTPSVGKDKLMRDPCIIKGGDGKYHMVWTVSWTDKGIGYATSNDLVNWSTQQFIPVMGKMAGTRNTWAPEITYDDARGVYMIYWASTIEGKYPETKSKKENGYNHRMYYTTTKDFKTFTDTKVLYEPGFNVIDSSIYKWDDKFIMFLKDETVEPEQKNIKMAFSDNLEGPYSQASNPISGDYWAEGPTAIRIDGKWIVYFDKYKNHAYGAVASSDLKNWEDISDQVSFPVGLRHGTVFKAPRSLLPGLK